MYFYYGTRGNILRLGLHGSLTLAPPAVKDIFNIILQQSVVYFSLETHWSFLMRTISAERLRQAVEALILSVSRTLPPDVCSALQKACTQERSAQGREVLRQLLANADYAEE